MDPISVPPPPTHPKAKNGIEYVFETEEQVRSLWLNNLQQVLSVASVNQELGGEQPSRFVRAGRVGPNDGVGIGWLFCCSRGGGGGEGEEFVYLISRGC